MIKISINLIIKFCLFIIIIFYLRNNVFSEIYLYNQKLKNHIIISFTSTRRKIESLLVDRLIQSLLNQTIVPYKFLLSINKNDIVYITDFMENLIKNDIIQLIFINEDMNYFNRYYYIPDEYKKYIIIVVDDDIILEKDSIEKLFNSYLLYPDSISALRVYKMNFDEKWNLKDFYEWDEDHKGIKKPLFSLFAIHGGGALFPPNTLNVTDDFIFPFKETINADDFIIKYYELNKNLKTIYVNNTIKQKPINIKYYEKNCKIFSISPNELQLSKDFGKKFNITIYNDIVNEKVEITKEIMEYYLNIINYNKISNETLLVSMTSYPARIYGITEVFFSLLYQSADKSSYQCFLTLAKEEFIHGEKDLPLEIQKLIQNGWIKIIWHHNIYSHKKLIPIMQYYPENDILIVDDDVIRTYNFIELFQKDHRTYPNDIICGQFNYYFNNNIEIQRMKGYKGKNCGEFNAVPNIIFQTARSANGGGGVYYPKRTFSDKRFFNESLFMNLSPTSDESWQHTFLIIGNKILRQTSVIIDSSANFVNNSQKILTSLHKINSDKYIIINENLKQAFPEYKINSIERQKKIIVSIASHYPRLKKLNLVLESIINNTIKPSMIVLTISKNDLNLMPKYLNDLIANKTLELIIADVDLKSHNKYFYVMKKYPDYAIITIDDDIIYTNDLIESLYNSYINNPYCIHARYVHKIMIKKNSVLPYAEWLKEYKYEINPSFYLFPCSEGGILFPPNILDISNKNIDEINKYLKADDIYLKYLSRKRNIKIKWVPNKFPLGLKQLKSNEVRKKFDKIRSKIKDIYLNIFPII